MRRTLIAVAAASVAFLVAIQNAWAGSPHFVQSATTASVSGNTLTVMAKDAGLGDEAQIHVVLTATALCINGGGNHPKAVNKASVSAAADEPVQNGKADYTISVTATFQPSCDPPMTVSFTDILLTDTTNNLTASIPRNTPVTTEARLTARIGAPRSGRPPAHGPRAVESACDVLRAIPKSVGPGRTRHHETARPCPRPRPAIPVTLHTRIPNDSVTAENGVAELSYTEPR